MCSVLLKLVLCRGMFILVVIFLVLRMLKMVFIIKWVVLLFVLCRLFCRILFKIFVGRFRCLVILDII